MNKQNYSNSIIIMIFCILIAGNTFSITTGNQNSKQFIVVIDPGHGGNDPGAINKNVREKDVVLAIGLKLGKLINENNPDVKVIFTRNTDVFIPLIDRSRIANKSKADLFISIHANICSTPSIRGTETFFLGPAREEENLDVAKKENSVILLEEDYSTTYEGFDPNSSESYIMFEMAQSIYLKQSLYLADAIQQQFKSRSDAPNRGVKQAGFLVLRMSSMPSVLVETGFLSNPSEVNYLNSTEGQQNIALSIYEAFKKFKNKNSIGGDNKTTDLVDSKQKSQDSTPKQEMVASHQKPQESAPKQEVIANHQKTQESAPKQEVIANHQKPQESAPKQEVIVNKQKPQGYAPKEEVIVNKQKSQESAPKQEVIANKEIPLESTPKQEVIASKQKPEDPRKVEVVNSTINPEKAKSEKVITPNSEDSKNIEKTTSTDYYSVQIGANTTPVEPISANFKGLKNVRREKDDKYYRYFIGHENNIDNLASLLEQAKLKFPQAFIISFINGKRVPLKVVQK